MFGSYLGQVLLTGLPAKSWFGCARERHRLSLTLAWCFMALRIFQQWGADKVTARVLEHVGHMAREGQHVGHATTFANPSFQMIKTYRVLQCQGLHRLCDCLMSQNCVRMSRSSLGLKIFGVMSGASSWLLFGRFRSEASRKIYWAPPATQAHWLRQSRVSWNHCIPQTCHIIAYLAPAAHSNFEIFWMECHCGTVTVPPALAYAQITSTLHRLAARPFANIVQA